MATKDFKAMAGEGHKRSDKGRLEPVTQNVLGRELRALYDQIASEPVPERFVHLLNQLERTEHDGQGSRHPEDER